MTDHIVDNTPLPLCTQDNTPLDLGMHMQDNTPLASCTQPLASCTQPLTLCMQPLTSCTQPLASCTQPLASCTQPLASCTQDTTLLTSCTEDNNPLIPRLCIQPLSFKLVGDNIDKNVKARYLRSDHGNSSLHYFHSFAVKDRIDFSHLSSTLPFSCSNSPSKLALEILPSVEDDATLKSLFKVHVSRILVDNLEFFKVTCQDVAIRHVPHLYSRQMSMKSTVVSYENIVANCFIHICTCRYL